MLQTIFRPMYMLALAALLMASPWAEAGRLQPIYTPDPIDIPAGKSANDVNQGIRKALFSLDFKTKEIGPGHLEATHVKHSRDMEHTAVLTVKYDSKTVRITYKDSKDLNYDPKEGEIHGTYNRWVRNVEKRIRSNLGSY
jgi:hypothetical protein